MKTLACVLLLQVGAQAQASCVILLHGLARSSSSMEKMEAALTEENFLVVNVDYPSTFGSKQLSLALLHTFGSTLVWVVPGCVMICSPHPHDYGRVR